MNNVSYIKIGGFDEMGALNNVSGNPNFTYLSTVSNKNWALPLDRLAVFGMDDVF